MSPSHTGSDLVSERGHLEVVSEGPVSKHLKEGVVVDISAHVLQVVVFAAGADALLAVHHSAVRRHRAPGVHGSQEDRLELTEKLDEPQPGLEKCDEGPGETQTVLKNSTWFGLRF